MVLLRSITGIFLLSLSVAGRAQTQTLKASLYHTFKAHSAPSRQLAFSPDSKTLATSGVDSVVKLWRVPDGKLSRSLIHPEGVTSIAFSRDGQWLVTGSYDNNVRVWRVRDGSLARTLKGHARPVWSVDISPDGQLIASGGEDKTVRLWRLSDGSPLRTLKGHALNVSHSARTAGGWPAGAAKRAR